MSFLLPFVKERETQSNIPLSESQIDETPENIDNSPLNDISEEDVSVSSILNESIKPAKRPKLLKTGETQVSKPTSSTITPSVRKYRRETNTEPETASSVLMKYLISNKERPAPLPPCDPIDAFFNSLAGTVKTFSLYYQNIAKTRLLNVVSELELAQMQQIPNISGQRPYSHESVHQPTPSPSESIYDVLSPPSSSQSLQSGIAPLQNYIRMFSPDDQQ